jgi:hypothetical protein
MVSESRSAQEFSVRRIEGELPQSELLWRGEPLGVRVDGVTLEHQVSLDAGSLLFLTEDSPYEEGLHIYLVDEERQLVDGLELAGPYAAGLLRDVVAEDQRAVSFTFFGDDRWRVEVHDPPLGSLRARIAAPAKRKPGLSPTRRLTVQRLV